ncbi:MAG: transposase [Anaerolineales bacterium]|nr:transposase [Anaerolineales bacterium]
MARKRETAPSTPRRAVNEFIHQKFPKAKRQRCVKHKMENVLGYVPEKQQDLLKPELRAIFYQTSREKANQEVAAFIAKYEKVYPAAVECLQRDLEACLTFYNFPEKHWKYIRTTAEIVEQMNNPEMVPPIIPYPAPGENPLYQSQPTKSSYPAP